MTVKLYRLFITWPLQQMQRFSKAQLPRFQTVKKAPVEPFPQTFVMESFFLQELITALTPGADEEMRFLTGPKIGPVRIVCRMAAPVSLNAQSPVFVGATPKAVASVLIPIIEQGAQLHICAHSHPGRGAGATTPSGIDIDRKSVV